MGEVTIIVAVADGRAPALRDRLQTLARAPVSPFSGLLPPTHFARFVVIELEAGGAAEPSPHLLFSARFDGSARRYLAALAAAPEAQRIFAHCRLPDQVKAGDAAALAAQLRARGIRASTPYTVSAVPEGVTVASVNAALALRDELRRFLTGPRFGRRGTVTMRPDPVAAVHDLRQLPSIRRLTEEL